MLQQLKKVYPSIIPYSATGTPGYIWFITENNERFGIHEADMTEKDVVLLTTFLKRFNPTIPLINPAAEQWQKRIDYGTDEVATDAFRFVYFILPKNQIQPVTFQEALNELFNQEIPLLWINETEGLLVETIPFLDSKINYEQFIHVFIADLSVNVRFYIGEVRKTYEALKSYYDHTIHQASIVLSQTTKEVIHYAESIPYLLLHRMSHEEKTEISISILKAFMGDSEMMKTLDVFFESNLNISETAKQMYMHRNSVQYRIDKFINESGINIQSFNEAIAVKIALLAKGE